MPQAEGCCGRSKKRKRTELVPSRSMQLSMISPAPRRSTPSASVMASMYPALPPAFHCALPPAVLLPLRPYVLQARQHQVSRSTTPNARGTTRVADCHTMCTPKADLLPPLPLLAMPVLTHAKQLTWDVGLHALLHALRGVGNVHAARVDADHHGLRAVVPRDLLDAAAARGLAGPQQLLYNVHCVAANGHLVRARPAGIKVAT